MNKSRVEFQLNLLLSDILKINFPMKDEPLAPEKVKRIIDHKKMDEKFWNSMKL
jgi:hypothetical protein